MLRILTLLFLSLWTVHARFEFTNLKCKSIDPKFVAFEHCAIKAYNRSFKYIKLKSNLLKKPVTSCAVELGFYKKGNHYLPFLYNYSVDGCKFLKAVNSYPVPKFFYNAMLPFTNLNHTCPLDDDIILDKLSTKFLDKYARILPFPEGSYLIETRWTAYNVLRAIVQLYFDFSLFN